MVEPCADVILSAAARRVILTGGGGTPIDFFRRRRRQLNVGGVGVRSEERGSYFSHFYHIMQS